MLEIYLQEVEKEIAGIRRFFETPAVKSKELDEVLLNASRDLENAQKNTDPLLYSALLKKLYLSMELLSTLSKEATLRYHYLNEARINIEKLSKISQKAFVQLQSINSGIDNHKNDSSPDALFYTSNLAMQALEETATTLLYDIEHNLKNNFDFKCMNMIDWMTSQQKYNLQPTPAISLPQNANDWNQSPINVGIVGFLVGGIIFRPVVKSLLRTGIYAGREISRAASYTYESAQRCLNFFSRPANYQAIPMIDEEDVVIDIQPSNVELSNAALLTQVDAVTATNPDWRLLSEKEIEDFKEMIGCKELEIYMQDSECALLQNPIVNPITITGNYSNAEGEAGRHWTYTVDAEALKTFIKQCTQNKMHAFAPASRDQLNDESHVTFNNGFAKAAQEPQLINYAMLVRTRLSLWKAEAQPIEVIVDEHSEGLSNNLR
jgi:hypothetical protein